MKRQGPGLLLSALACAVFVALFATSPSAAPRDEHFGFVYTSPEAIGDAQSMLVQAGYLKAGSYRQGDVDEPTKHALIEFQRWHTLRQTGMVDWETMALLPEHAHAAARPARPVPPPAAPVDRDSDGDGVLDSRDKCPDTTRGATVDSDGCPQDSDGDGVYDGLDRCPDTPRRAKVDAHGCPLDSDGDGVFDGLDRCPDTPRGTKVDSDGCPEPAKAEPLFQGNKKSLVLEGVNFETNSATLTHESHAILDRVADSLKDSPEVKVEVGGHTDSMGSDVHNQKLSEARAESVKRYLVSRGVDASRLKAKGYGEGKPIADNGTPAGRAKNRRVELTRID